MGGGETQVLLTPDPSWINLHPQYLNSKLQKFGIRTLKACISISLLSSGKKSLITYVDEGNLVLSTSIHITLTFLAFSVGCQSNLILITLQNSRTLLFHRRQIQQRNDIREWIDRSQTNNSDFINLRTKHLILRFQVMEAFMIGRKSLHC